MVGKGAGADKCAGFFGKQVRRPEKKEDRQRVVTAAGPLRFSLERAYGVGRDGA